MQRHQTSPKMNLAQILNLIDERKLNELGRLYKMDKSNHKIVGPFILKTFVNSILKGYAVSLRALEKLSNTNQNLSNLLHAKVQTNKQIDHSSIGKRLAKIEVNYFRDIYQDLVDRYNQLFGKNGEDKFCRFDSTIITLSGKLLKDGLKLGGKAQDKHIKLSIGLTNNIPSSVRICNQASESSEDVALVRAINEAKTKADNILLFDRGISKGNTFKAFDQERKQFITRLKIGRKHLKMRDHHQEAEKEEALIDSTHTQLAIESDEVINLYNRGGKPIDCELRLIKAKNQAGEQLWFLTNVFYLTAHQVCCAYKKRWEIEVFFKMIKQNLQYNCFVSHNTNGMSVYLYCVLIATILFVIFKLTNQLSGFKLALLQFRLALEKELIKDIVLFCGGDPKLVDLKLADP